MDAEFARDSVDFVDRSLKGNLMQNRISSVEPGDMLIDWLTMARDDDAQLTVVDAAFAHWCERHWAQSTRGKTEVRRAARAWQTLFDVVAYFDFFNITANFLLEHVSEREDFLWPMSTGSALDPVGRFLLAVANYQNDRSLVRTWWQLCDLPPDVPAYHAPYAIAGIRGLPGEEDGYGGFRDDVFESLVRVALALDRCVDESRVTESDARRELVSLSTLTVAAFPFPGKWSSGTCQQL